VWRENSSALGNKNVFGISNGHGRISFFGLDVLKLPVVIGLQTQTSQLWFKCQN
jgi:hypothetical protein